MSLAKRGLGDHAGQIVHKVVHKTVPGATPGVPGVPATTDTLEGVPVHVIIYLNFQ